MTERRGTKALELWCRRITDGYPGVNVQNMTTSWRDGLAFCAMIHHFRPDLIDFDSLNKDDVYSNNELAFRTAAEHLGIPALLDAEDMASCSVPDRLSILTYLSQFYQSFGGSSPSRLALSRTKESSNEGITPVVAESTTPKVGPRMGMRREACAVCGMPVFLAEKLVISRSPYHRTCFRCARCSNQLTPGNYYETEEGQYCCETCPDEEDKSISPDTAPIYHQAYNEAMIHVRENANPMITSQTEVYQRSLSDEEKTERRARLTSDILNGETRKIESSRVNEETLDGSLISDKKHSQTAQMRLSFMADHLISEKQNDNTESSSRNSVETSLTIIDADAAIETRTNGSRSLSSGESEKKRRDPRGSLIKSIVSDENVDFAGKMPRQREQDDSPINFAANLGISDVSDSFSKVAHPAVSEKSDYLDARLVDSKDVEPREFKCFDNVEEEPTRSNDDRSSSENTRISIRRNTKDKIGPEIDVGASVNEESRLDSGESHSLVQRRRRMFESQKNEKIWKKDPRVVDSIGGSLDDRNIELTGVIDERENVIFAEITRIPEISSTIDPTIVEEIKTSQVLPPCVPKRSNLKARRDERSRVRSSDITVLSASGIDLSDVENYPKDLNPFDSDEENSEERGIDESHDLSRSSRVSTNPFGSSSEDENDENPKIVVPPRPATRNFPRVVESSVEVIAADANATPTKRRLKAPQINFNPFWSDEDEEHESEDEQENLNYSLNDNTPVPKPRTIKQTADSSLSPWKNDLNRGEIYASNSSLASTGSASTPGGTFRKKKPAPPPPIVRELYETVGDSPSSSNTYTGSNNSLRTIPRARKAKPAPPPPTSTPCKANLIAGNMTLDESPIRDNVKIIESRDYELWKDPKNDKDEANRNKRSMAAISRDETSPYEAYTDKSVQGKWKRKKGPAPARPIPHRRKIKVMSLKDVKLELDEIEMQQQGLEKQGVRLEQLIRDKAETGNATGDTSLGMDVEELVLELFVLVNEKNELFRRQAELMLLRRQQRLEEEHADIEYQIRCLLCQPEATKTDFDKQREETLIQRLVEIVERRNEIVECLEMDRRREVEEDRSINTQMGIYAAKNKGDLAKELEAEDESNRSRKSKKTKLKEKAKEKILRKVHKKDADKDVDETEVKLKRQNKKKWF